MEEDFIDSDDGLLDYGTIWAIRDFTVRSSYIVYKDLEGNSLPDSISIEVVSINGSDSTKIKQRFMIFKVEDARK